MSRITFVEISAKDYFGKDATEDDYNRFSKTVELKRNDRFI